MVSFTRLATLLSAAFNASALTLSYPPQAPESKCCMAPSDAQTIVSAYQQLIANYTDTLCERYCAPDLYDFSDSISTLAGRPTGQPLVTSKQAFMASQKQIPPSPLIVESVPITACDHIALIWSATFGQAAKTARGITILTTTLGPQGWMIRGIDVEFNSLAWLEDMGGSYSLPPPPPPPSTA